MTDIRFSSQIDDFNRADETPLASPWAQTDSGYLPSLILKSNAVTHAGGQVSGDSYWTTNSFDDSVIEVWAIPTGGGGGAAGIAWAIDFWQNPGGSSGQNDGYRFRNEHSIGNAQNLYRITNGAGPAIAGPASGFTSASGDIMLLRYTKATALFECFLSTDNGANWTLQMSVSDSTYTPPFYVGLGIVDNSGGQILAWTAVGAGTRTIRKRAQIYRWVSN